MYDYIKGTIANIKNNAIVLDNNGVGFLIYVSNPYSFELGKDYKVYVYQQIKEDENCLYGFKTIERENVLYLKKFPKIGDKLAKQIILDLKGKLEFIGLGISDDIVQTENELKEVLIGLGYKEKELVPVLAKVNTSLTIEEQVKDALKLLLK